MNYGTRARLGMLLPSVNRAAEPDMNALLPGGVSLHTTRLRLRSGAPEHVHEMVERLEEGSELLADAGVDLIMFHCTAASMMAPGFDDKVIDRIEAASGIPATSTSKGCLAAFRMFGATRITLTTPYVQDVNDREVAYLESHGIEVLSDTAMGIAGDGGAMLAVEPGEWRRRVGEQDQPESDAAFISCTAVRAVGAVADIEGEIGKPVVTSNQATLWHALRTVGVDDAIPGYGRLLESTGVRAAA